MGIEEKVKAYDEALKQAKKELAVCGSINCDAARQIFRLFPQLRESEDERVIRTLYYLVRDHDWLNGATKGEALAWLEKQKDHFRDDTKMVEQKSAENGVDVIKTSALLAADRLASAEMTGRLKERSEILENPEEYGLQKPAEWSEDDEEMYINVASSLRGYAYGLENEEHKKHIKKGLDWLENRFKSLRPQPKKESAEEKIMNFFDAIGDCGFTQADILKLKSIWKECGLPSPQPHWKPSEQEKGALRTAIHILTEERSFPKAAGHLQAILDAFEGKESRKDWKPSEEQMNYLCAAVDAAIRKHNESVSGYEPAIVLKSLYEQLQKLM